MNIRFVPAVAGLALLVAGCRAASPPEQPPLAGARIGGPFALTDENGRTATDRDLAGKWRIMYFGYTFCPDICPTDAQNIGAGLKKFEKDDPERGARVTPVFITVDPARDTPAVLKTFTNAFHPRMLGLTGSTEAIARTAKAYAVYYAKGDLAPGGGYLMDHQRVTYLMDPQGRPVALLPADKSADAVAAELARWVT
ncbi:SCO family protein [uncultured Sphingomonas sp.]|uniref:SCO family protein n=1 Tax=uncultured Sphingomonas sp. TaxID=158754 RepID=UPI0035CA6B07